MAGLMDKVSKLARSRQGRQLMERAQRVARDPKARRRITEARSRLAKRGTGTQPPR